MAPQIQHHSAQHVVSNPSGGWDVKKAGARRATRHFLTKREAVAYARALSRELNAELIVHGRDGRVLKRYSFDVEPLRSVKRPSRGFGCAKGLIVIPPEFDDPIDGMDPYSE